MNNEQKRKHYIKILTSMLKANIDIMEYHRVLAKDKESKKIINKSISQSKKAIELLPQINHIEILDSMFRAFVNGKEIYFSTIGALICSKKFNRYDKTKKGFKEFMELELQAKEDAIKKEEEAKQEREAIKKAKEEGKEIEYVMVNGKVRALIKEKPIS